MTLFSLESAFKTLLAVEQCDKNAPPDPEGVVLLRRLAHALGVAKEQAQLVALRVLTKCIRDGSVSRNDLIELRDNPLPAPEDAEEQFDRVLAEMVESGEVTCTRGVYRLAKKE